MELSKEVIVATVTAFAALVVSVIGLLSARKSAREQRLAQLEIETIKHEMALKADRREKQETVLKTQIDLITKDIELIQEARDILRRFVDAPNGVARVSENVDFFSRLISKVDAQYRKQYYSDSKSYVNLLHDAKDIMYSVWNKLDSLQKLRNNTSDLSSAEQAYIRYARESLQSIQEKMRSEHIDILSRYVEL
jgi:hypothetical protein